MSFVNKHQAAESSEKLSDVGEVNGHSLTGYTHTPLFHGRVTRFDRWLARAMMDLVGNPKGTLRLWDLESATSRVLEGHGGRVSGAVVLSDSTRALSWSRDSTIRLWDLAKIGVDQTLKGHRGWVYGVVVSGSGRRALSWGADKTLRLWDLSSVKQIACFIGDDPLTCCALNAGGTLAVVGDSRGRVMCFELPVQSEN